MGTIFGSKLSERIAAEGLDPQTFASKAKIPAPTVYHWLDGRGIRPHNAVKVAQFFDEDPAIWLRYAGYPVGTPGSPDEEEQGLLTLLRGFPTIRESVPDMARLNPRNQKLVRDLIRNLAEDEGTVQDPPTP